MVLSENGSIYDELWKSKLNWGRKRIQFAYYSSLAVLIVNLSSEYYYNGLVSNIPSKLYLILFYSTFFLFYNISKIFPKRIGHISFICGEISIMLLFYKAFFTDSDHSAIYLTISVLIFVYFQSYLFMKISEIMLFGLKKVFSLFLFSYLSGRFSSTFDSTTITCLFLVPILMVACMYFEYLQDIEVYQTKQNVQLSLDKIESIVGAIPDGITTLNSSLTVVFTNAKMKEIINGIDLLQYFAGMEYYSVADKSCSRYIIDDISNAFKKDIGYELQLGVTKNFDQLIEWKGKVVK